MSQKYVPVTNPFFFIEDRGKKKEESIDNKRDSRLFESGRSSRLSGVNPHFSFSVGGFGAFSAVSIL